jgi:Na+/H+ antiporter NhaD/arsenite permease-like protein
MWTSKFLNMSVKRKEIYVEFMRAADEFMRRLREGLKRAILIGVDLGPNLSVTGSLATILWLTALRRAGQAIGGDRFLRLGVLAMPPAVVLAIAAAVPLP